MCFSLNNTIFYQKLIVEYENSKKPKLEIHKNFKNLKENANWQVK